MSMHDHDCDADCTLDSDEQCVVCGVSHTETCHLCGGRGFHRPTCVTMAVCGACRGPFGECDCAETILPASATASQLERFTALFRLLGSNVDPKRAAHEAARMLGFERRGAA